MSKYAVIDIGTNSTRLLIASVKNNVIVKREKYLLSTRMGQGVDHNRIIHLETMKRNIAALKEFKEISQSHGVEDTILFGTSALRDAKNGHEFVRLAQEELQMTVDIIDGKLEAQYAFLGVGKQFKDEMSIIMDIGGGSTEFVCSAEGGFISSDSLNIGAVRLTERFIKNDPPLANEINQIKIYVRNLLQDKIIKEKGMFTLVGIGGTATTLATIKHSMKEYLPDEIHGSKVSSKDTDKIIDKLVSMDDKERKAVVGLDSKRSDIIIAGIIIVQEILFYYEKDHFFVSDYDNLEGALYFYLKKYKKKY